MATVNLGSIKFNWKGSYSGATAYVVDDVVESGGNSYVCILASTGNTPPNATYWELMAQAGTNGTDGTDLTTTLTTQGDIVYRDASGLARLGAGTSGQVLQTNGTGANPSWGTVSSDMVRITTVNGTGSSGVIALDNLFTSTYKDYYFRLKYVPDTASQPNLRFQDTSNTELTTGDFVYGGMLSTVNSGANSGGHSGGYAETKWFPRENTAVNSIRPSYYHGWLFDMNTTTHKVFTVSGHSHDGTYWRGIVMTGMFNLTTALGGFRISASSGNLKTETELVVYGIKV